MKPKISCVVATRNRAHLVRNMLMSLKNQTIRDWEVLVVQNWSQDWTNFVMDTLSDKRMHFFEIDEKGKSPAMNFAKDHVKGDYVAFFDDDDIMMPSKLKASLEMLKDTKTDLCYSARYTLLPNNEMTYTPTREFVFEDFIEKPCIGFGSIVCKRDVFIENDFKEDMPASMDFDWIANVALSGATMSYTQLPLYVWRNHLESITYGSNIIQRQEWEKSKERALRRFKRMKPHIPKAKEWYPTQESL